jgi:drug/metabolite transporter (DMT)-like permease
VLVATVLALAAAVLHAGWNLAVKTAEGDRFVTLWGQFFCGGTIGIIGLVVAGAAGHTMPWSAVWWVAASGTVHLPYCWFLARAYAHGDFSLVYPLARGGGALIAAFGGVVLLGDRLSPLGIVSIVVVCAGLTLLAGSSAMHARSAMVAAAVVAATIGAYSVIDAHGVRSSGTRLYALASVIGTMVSTTVFLVASRRTSEMVAAMRTGWRRFGAMGLATTVTYGMVQVAFSMAPVGYVTALRESSVVIAALVGTRLLGESAGGRRTTAAGLVLGGLVLLVVAR